MEIYSKIFIFLYTAAWGITYYNHTKKCVGSYKSGSFILLTYFGYAICSFFLYQSGKYDFGTMHLFQFIYLFTLMYIGLMPVLSFDKASVKRIIPPPSFVLNVFTILYIIITILFMPSVIGNIEEGIALLLLDSSGGLELYNDRLSEVRKQDYGVSNIFSIFYNIFKDCATLVFFYYLTVPKEKRITLIILSFAVLSPLLVSLANGNRTQVTLVILSLIASYFLFSDFYSDKIRRVVKIISISIGSVIAFLFLTLTISRFGDLDEGGFDSMLYYVGQAPLYFNEYALDAGGVRYGDRTTNLFKKFLGFSVPEGIFDTRMKHSAMAIDDSVFTTYIGDFVIDFGPFLTPLLVIIFTFLIFKSTKTRNNTIYFYQLIPIYYVMTVSVRGGMYLFCYPFMDNLVILAYIFFYFSCKLFQNKINHKCHL